MCGWCSSLRSIGIFFDYFSFEGNTGVRAFVLLSFLCLYISQLDAQTLGPSKRASLEYKSQVFHVPYIPFVSDGSARRTGKDCQELSERLKAENGRGVVTSSYNEFMAKLKLACGNMESGYPQYESTELNEEGLICTYKIFTKCSISEAHFPNPYDPDPVRDWCEFWISEIAVENQRNVHITFDLPNLPCECEGKKRVIDCSSAFGEVSQL